MRGTQQARKQDQKRDGGEEKETSREGDVGREEQQRRCLERAEVWACLRADQEELVAGWPHPGLLTGCKCLSSTPHANSVAGLLFSCTLSDVHLLSPGRKNINICKTKN